MSFFKRAARVQPVRSVAAFGVPSLIHSIQQGTTPITGGNLTATSAITAVDPQNTILFTSQYINVASGSDFRDNFARAELLNSTTVQITRLSAVDAAAVQVVGWTAVSFLPGVIKSIQRGSATITVGNNATLTINAVDTTKSIAMLQSWAYNGPSAAWAYPDYSQPIIQLTNATTVTILCTLTTNTNAGIQVVEFY